MCFMEIQEPVRLQDSIKLDSCVNDTEVKIGFNLYTLAYTV